MKIKDIAIFQDGNIILIDTSRGIYWTNLTDWKYKDIKDPYSARIEDDKIVFDGEAVIDSDSILTFFQMKL